MDLLKKLMLTSIVGLAMLVTAPAAFSAGKVENQTQEEVRQSLLDSISAAEEALAAIKSNADAETVLDLLKKTKQTAKTIESSVVLVDRDRALAKVNKARSAYKKDQRDKAEELMIQAVDKFKKLNEKFHNF